MNNIIAGILKGAAGMTVPGEHWLQRQHEHNEQSQRLWHDRQKQLVDQMEKFALQHEGPERERIQNMIMKVGVATPENTPDLAKHAQEYSKIYDDVQRTVAERRMAKAREIPAVVPPNAQNSGPMAQAATPFSSMIGRSVQGAFPGPQMPAPMPSAPTALPPTSPVAPDAPPMGAAPSQGGGNSVARFSGAPGQDGAPGDVQPVPPNSTVPPAHPLTIPGLGGPALDFDRSVEWANAGGSLDALTSALIPEQAKLSGGLQKLPLVQQIMSQMSPTSPGSVPDISQMMKVNAELAALGIQGGMGNMVGPMLTQLNPRSLPGETTIASVMTTFPGFLESQGFPVEDMDPNTPVRLTMNHQGTLPIGAQVQSYATRFIPTAEGYQKADPRLGTVSGPIEGATPVGMAPLTRTSSREQWLNLGDRLVRKNISSSTTSQRQRPNLINADPGEVFQPLPVPAPRGAAPAGANVPPVTPPARGSAQSPDVLQRGLSPLQVNNLKNSVEIAATQLFGDKSNPSFVPLSSYAELANDPGSRKRIGDALKIVLDNGGREAANDSGAHVGPVSISAGGLGDWFANATGITKAAASSRAKVLRDATGGLSQPERDYFNALMNTIPAITGMRKLTSGSSFKWAQNALENELPMIGLAGVNSAYDFRKKLTALGEEQLRGLKNLEYSNPTAVDHDLMQLIQSGGITAPKSTSTPNVIPSVSGDIEVISPEGISGTIPADKWDAAQKRGFKRAPVH